GRDQRRGRTARGEYFTRDGHAGHVAEEAMKMRPRPLMTRQIFVLSHLGLAVTALAVALARGALAAQPAPLAARIVPTDPSRYRPLTAVRAGAGNRAFVVLRGRGAIGPHFNFLHRGEIPAGSGIGHHFHSTVEEMFVILGGEAQFTVDGRTSVGRGPATSRCN